MVNWKLCPSPNKHYNLLVKIVIAILFMGLVFRFFSSDSTEFSSQELEIPVADKSQVAKANPPAVFPTKVKENEDQTQIPQMETEDRDVPTNVTETEKDQDVSTNGTESEDEGETPLKGLGPEKCDLFVGDWIPNPSGPVYTNATCPLIEGHQNCMRNGRPDSGYLYWRWKPRDCDLAQFDADIFLEKMRDKNWALIGDSISRNHVQSFLCMLSTAEEAVEVYHDEEYKSKRWNFPSYNFSVSVIWSPFLAKAAIFEDNNGVSSSEVELHLDKLDKKWTDQFRNLDYMIISTGKWFLKSSVYYENNTVSGCHYCPKRNFTELGFDFAYRKVLHSVMDFLATSNHTGSIFFRTSTPDHFENGEWHNGGTCPKTAPVKEGESEMKDLHKILREIELSEFHKAAQKAVENGVNFKLLDFTNLLLARPDGHPGPYREFQPFAKDKTTKVQNDCLHWCLPGPLDAWNDLIMELIFNG